MRQGKLPEVSHLLNELPLHTMHLDVSETGVVFTLRVDQACGEAVFPQVEKGCGLEIFIDTRGLSEANMLHKYCHHFVCLPHEVDGVVGVEVTRFRTSDTRELAKPEHIQVTTTHHRRSYSMEVHLTRAALFGFDPEEYPIRFAYIVHHYPERNSFPKNSHEVLLKEHPSLWALVRI